MRGFRNPGLRLAIGLVAVAAAGYRAWQLRGPGAPAVSVARVAVPDAAAPQATAAAGTDAAILAAIRDQRSHVWGQAAGVVTRLIKDDREGTPHQRFLVRLESGTTVLVAYNLDLAPRIAPLAVGDSVTLRGEYIWNDKGGLMHWVHRDPSGREPGGWVQVHGREFR
jgi:hypothetical protein